MAGSEFFRAFLAYQKTTFCFATLYRPRQASYGFGWLNTKENIKKKSMKINKMAKNWGKTSNYNLNYMSGSEILRFGHFVREPLCLHQNS